MNADLPEATATGIGSMPGGDAREAAKTATGSFEDLPFLPELPARGPGADMIGRTARAARRDVRAASSPAAGGSATAPAGTPSGPGPGWARTSTRWRSSPRGTRGRSRSRPSAPGRWPPRWNCGSGEAALRDPGACRDLAGSLAEGLRAPPGRRTPRGSPAPSVVLQLDEPSLTARTARAGQDRQRLPHLPRGRPAGRRGARCAT